MGIPMVALSSLYPLVGGLVLLAVTVVIIFQFRRWRRADSTVSFEYPDADPPGGYEEAGDQTDPDSEEETSLKDRLLRYVYPFRRR